MRILITCHAAMGGSGIMATELAVALAQAGNEVHVVSDRRPFRLQEAAAMELSLHVHTVDVPSHPVLPHDPYVLALADAMATIIDVHAIEVVNVHYLLPLAPAAALACQMAVRRPRLVLTMHGTDVSGVGADPAVRRSLSWSIQQADCVTAVSNWLAELGQETFAIRSTPTVIGNSVDPAIFSADDRIDWGQQPTTFLHVSNFRPVKRTTDVVRAFAVLRQKYLPHATLLMVGDGPDFDAVRKLAQELCIDHAITWAGRQNDVATFYRQAHLLLQPSESEACPLTVLEAYACGTPVVGTRVGGMTELLGLGGGLSVPVGNITALVSAAYAVTSDEVRWRAMQQQALTAIQQQFLPEHVVQRYLARYSNRSTIAEPELF